MGTRERVLGAEQTITVGQPVAIETNSPDGARGVVFGDEGESAYSYAGDYSAPDQPFVDARHIYTVEAAADRHIASGVHILWSGDYTKAALIAGYTRASSREN